MFTKFFVLFALAIGTAQAAYFPSVSIDNFDSFGVYNLTLPVLTDGGMSQLQVDVNGKLLVVDNHTSDWSSLLSSISSIDGKLASLGQKAMAGSVPVVIASDQSAIPITGSISVTNPSVGTNGSAIPTSSTLSGASDGTNLKPIKSDANGELQVDVLSSALPTGAATETTLSAISTKLTDKTQATKITDGSVVNGIRALNTPVVGTDYGLITNSVMHGLTTGGGGGYVDVKVNPSGALTVDATVSSSALPSGAATETTLSALNTKVPANLTVSSTRLLVDGSGVTQPVSIAAAVATKAPVNASGSTASASISAVATLTAPANAVEVIIQADDSNTANLRFAVNATATTTDGIQLQPGRSETLKVGSNISIIPESGTQKYNVIWVTQ